MLSVPSAFVRSCGALLLQCNSTQGAAASANMCLKSRKDTANYHGGKRHRVGKNNRKCKAGWAFLSDANSLERAHALICMPRHHIQHIDKTNRYFNPVWAKTNK